MSKRKKPAAKQTPRERLIPGNVRIKAPSGRTTWAVKVEGGNK